MTLRRIDKTGLNALSPSRWRKRLILWCGAIVVGIAAAVYAHVADYAPRLFSGVVAYHQLLPPMPVIDTPWSLWGMFLSAFVSSTLLPGGSEAVLLLLATREGVDKLLLLGVATAGNTLGGMSSWALGRVLAWRFPARPLNDKQQRALARIRRWGSKALLLSWLPVIGDPLCLAAGWLRIGWLPSLLFIAAGKAGRYAALLLLA